MAIMHTVIIKNNDSTDIEIPDLGIIGVPAGDQITLSNQETYPEIAGSDDLRTLVENGDLVVNDGSDDLSAADGVLYLTIVRQQYLMDTFYTRAQLQGSGQAEIHWNNLTNKPAFGDPSFVAPVLYRVLDIASDATASNVGDVYVDTDDDKYYKWNGAAWVDDGDVAEGDRVINLDHATENIHVFDSGAWADTTESADQTLVNVNDDGDGNDAQYVYDGPTDTWLKMGDIDYSGHFDGGAGKHDASEIDVEGTYPNVPSSPCDAETAISELSDAITSAAESNTLDEAYDEGGAGAGRAITADSGPVEIDNGGGTQAGFRLVPNATFPSVSLANGQVHVDADGIEYVYDGTRGKWLSKARMTMSFSRQGNSANAYLLSGEVPANQSGPRFHKDVCITGISCQLSNVSTGTLIVRKDDVAINLFTLAISSAQGDHDDTIDESIDAGSFLQCGLTSSVTPRNPVVTIWYAYEKK